MVKSLLKKSAPECPLECGGGCNCYLGNAQIKWALIKKGLPLETTLFSVSYFSHACLANRTLIREAPGIFSHTRIRTQQDQLLRLNTYCCVRSINSINWHTCVHSVHCTPFKIVTATAFLSEKIQFCAVEAPESHLLRKSRLAPDNQSWFNRFWPPGFVITFPVIDSAVLEGVFKRSIKDPALSHPYVSSVWRFILAVLPPSVMFFQSFDNLDFVFNHEQQMTH